MSYWTHLRGTITVSPMGRTDEEREYILKTVLKHLPEVSGSEGSMRTHIVQFYGYDMSCTHNEFMEPARHRDLVHGQCNYHLVIEANLRDRMFADTFREFTKWVCRLAKRVFVLDMQVTLFSDDHKPYLFLEDYHSRVYHDMWEDPSWVGDHSSINWCEYLMWDRERNGCYPAKLAYKYYSDESNDKRCEDWFGYDD